MNRFLLAAFFSGGLFGLGLAMSGMADPLRVLGFLDVFGHFDPTLLFVMGGAVTTTTLLFRYVLRSERPLFADRFRISTLRTIDLRLLVGAGVFGIGWGMAGYCPGPALAGLGVMSREVMWFVPAMIVGMLLHRAWQKNQDSKSQLGDEGAAGRAG